MMYTVAWLRQEYPSMLELYDIIEKPYETYGIRLENFLSVSPWFFCMHHYIINFLEHHKRRARKKSHYYLDLTLICESIMKHSGSTSEEEKETDDYLTNLLCIESQKAHRAYMEVIKNEVDSVKVLLTFCHSRDKKTP